MESTARCARAGQGVHHGAHCSHPRHPVVNIGRFGLGHREQKVAVDIYYFCTYRKVMKLTPTMERFILHWGEMGWRWGINRSVAQVHALLMLAPKPLPADEIGATLDVARSNVSTSLKELQAWGLV